MLIKGRGVVHSLLAANLSLSLLCSLPSHLLPSHCNTHCCSCNFNYFCCRFSNTFCCFHSICKLGPTHKEHTTVYRPPPTAHRPRPLPSTWFQLNWVGIGAEAFRRVANAALASLFPCFLSAPTTAAPAPSPSPALGPTSASAWHLIVFLRFSFPLLFAALFLSGSLLLCRSFLTTCILWRREKAVFLESQPCCWWCLSYWSECQPHLEWDAVSTVVPGNSLLFQIE